MEWKDNLTGLQHLGIPTKDIDKTIAYYQMIGFELVHETMNGENRVAFLKWNDLIIETYESDQVSEATGVVDHIAMKVPEAALNMKVSLVRLFMNSSVKW